MKSCKRIKILGKIWRLCFVKYPELGTTAYGDMRSPPDGPRRIRVKTGMSPLRTLDTIIHEMLHASNESLDEEHVNTLATDIARTILRPDIRPYWDPSHAIQSS